MVGVVSVHLNFDGFDLRCCFKIKLLVADRF